MADPKQRVLDVWIVELNKVYREVPFVVVSDWLQQGRLLPDDRVRLAGSQKWHNVSVVPALAPYLPKQEPHRADDQAEAMEPVELGFSWKRPGEEDDDEVDMIPLIDISLVLLIFFMMTSSVSSGILSTIDTPGAKHQLATITGGSLWVGIDSKNPAGIVERGDDQRALPWFSFGKENSELIPPTNDLQIVLAGLMKEAQSADGEVKIRLKADRKLPIETIKGVTLELQDTEVRLNRQREQGKGKLTFAILGEVSEPQEK